MQKLVIQDDEGKTTVVPLIRDEITIGRKEGNTIRLTERNVSRRHARILRGPEAVSIEDLNSYNGIRVNGSRIQGRCALSLSDRVQIGDYLIELKTGEAAADGDAASTPQTQPIERVDQAATTPMVAAGSAAPIPAVPTAVVSLSQVQGAPAGAVAALADTDPGTGAAQQVQAAAAGEARIVILSSNFAGRDFPLNKPAMVIGRTDDNDIVIDHRSISRHHAKIVRENGRYAIVDLQSSNGVRVNGEEYGKVELRGADIVDLGHVRMRFVDVGEDFVFGRDAQAVDIGGGSRKGLIFGAIGAILLVGVILMLTMGGGGDKKKQVASSANNNSNGKVAGTEPDNGAKAGTPAPAIADAQPENPSPAVATNDAAAKHIAAARAAINDDQWARALASAKAALKADPKSTDGTQLAAQAKREMANEIRYRDLQKFASKKNYKQVAGTFKKIDQESAYLEKARDVHDGTRDAYTKTQVAVAKRYAAAKKCRDIRRLAARSTKPWQEVADAVLAVGSECQTTVASASKPRSKPTPRSRPRSRPAVSTKPKPRPKPRTPTASASSGKSSAQLVREAKTAAKSAQFGKALRLCSEAIRKGGGGQDAAMVCAIAACNLKSASRAKRYIRSLSTSRRNMARQICLRNGVKID